MARQKIAPEVLAHLEWLGFVQPTGLVVSAPALVKAGAVLDRRDAEGQRLLRESVDEGTAGSGGEAGLLVPDFARFAQLVLGWRFTPKFYVGTAENPVPEELAVALPEYGETLRPDFAVREPEPRPNASEWQLLVRVLPPGEDFDQAHRGPGRLEASAHGRMERLLRQTGVLAGLLFNGTALRIVSAPRGESSGWLDFRVADMLMTAGRPICTALRLLLSERRLLALPRPERLTALLEDSRKYQNEVSERLAEQVLHALYELLRGFQAADEQTHRELLRRPLREYPDEVYHALLTVLLRLVFLLYAEERGMLPSDEAFVRSYSVAELHRRLREDAALFPDTMDQRFGAWAQLLALFRMIHDGAEADGMRLPERHGVLFDPDRFPFLEGRDGGGSRQTLERIEAPHVPDGTIYRALEKLLVLDGERISYRALDVEQIGSVYETMMGFLLETAHGRSLAIKPAKRLGAPVTIDLEALLGVEPGKREKWFVERSDRKLPERVKKSVKEAEQLEALHAALEPVVDREATPDVVPPGSMILQPSEERRRSGSHYTPRSLTEPIVRTTLAPVLDRLRRPDGLVPAPEQLLDLKICDPAMGSGAFLVEACRQLGDVLIKSWELHGGKPEVPADEDEVIYARRLIAQRCLYGVDRNPVAVDLAKMSLWLVTLAREHPLTFVDHALRHGDSLVGLSLQQIEGFHWDEAKATKRQGFATLRVREQIDHAVELRRRIRLAGDDVPEAERAALLHEADEELDHVKLLGDLVIAAFFSGEKARERDNKLAVFADAVQDGREETYRSWLADWRDVEQPLAPFHWQLEFPEVFDRANPGFDTIVGNPPFLGGKYIAPRQGDVYAMSLKELVSRKKGSADLSAYFLLRADGLLRGRGTAGLVATSTIAEGDTREVGLASIIALGHAIFFATSPAPWPGTAGVHYITLGIASGELEPRTLNGVIVPFINSRLRAGPEDVDPVKLELPAVPSSGTTLLGAGFILEPWEKHELCANDPDCADVIKPFLNGEDCVRRADMSPSRYVIDFGDMSKEQAARYPLALDRLTRLVKPQRDALSRQVHEKCYWKHWDKRRELYSSLQGMSQTLVFPLVSKFIVFAFVDNPASIVFSHKVGVLPLAGYCFFAVLQSRAHIEWVSKYSSSRGEGVNYSISDCLSTYPFPRMESCGSGLEEVGRSYYDFRTRLMARHDEGLTKTYNRFHDPDEDSSDVLKLRELHAAMDRAVLNACGWADIPTDCEFLLDDEVDQEESGRRGQPWRYRWPDEVRDEVLARLLELNAQRAAEEAGAGASAAKGRKAKARQAPAPDNERLL